MKKTGFYLFALVVFSVLFAYLYRCSTNRNKSTIGGQTVKVGVILPLSGDAAAYGTSLKKGLDVSIGNGIELVYEDSKGEPKTAVSSINKLINVDKVDIVIGDMFTNTTLAINPIANKNNILLLTPTASYSEISEQSSTTFRLYPSEKEEGTLLHDFAQLKFPEGNGAILVVNEDAMLNVANLINGDNTMQVIEYNKGILDVTPIVEKINKNVEVLFLIGYFDENVQLIKKSIDLKKVYNFIGLSTMYTPQLANVLGNIGCNLFMSAPKGGFDENETVASEFIHLYKSSYNESPDIWAGYGFDSGRIISTIIKNSKENGSNYISEMYNIKEFGGVTGVTTINKDRSISKSMDIIEYANGKFIPVEK